MERVAKEELGSYLIDRVALEGFGLTKLICKRLRERLYSRRAARDRLCKRNVCARAASEQLHCNIEWLGFC